MRGVGQLDRRQRSRASDPMGAEVTRWPVPLNRWPIAATIALQSIPPAPQECAEWDVADRAEREPVTEAVARARSIHSPQQPFLDPDQMDVPVLLHLDPPQPLLHDQMVSGRGAFRSLRRASSGPACHVSEGAQIVVRRHCTIHRSGHLGLEGMPSMSPRSEHEPTGLCGGRTESFFPASSPGRGRARSATGTSQAPGGETTRSGF